MRMLLFARRPVAGAAAALALGLLAATSLAAPPLHLGPFPYIYEGPMMGPDGQPIVCNVQPIQERTAWEDRLTFFYDKEGKRIRLQVHTRGTSVFINPDTGTEARATAGWQTTEKTPYDGSKYVGLFYHVVLPGVGVIMQDAGLQIYNWDSPEPVVKRAGTYQWNLTDYDEFCAAMQ